MRRLQQSFFDNIAAIQAGQNFGKDSNGIDNLRELTANKIKQNSAKKVILFEIPLDFSREIRRTVLSEIVIGFSDKANVYAYKFGNKSEHNFMYRLVKPDFNEYPKMWPKDDHDASLFAIEFRSHPDMVFKKAEGLRDLDELAPYLEKI